MQVIAIRYVSYSRALCGSKKTLGDSIRKHKESLDGRGRGDGLGTESDQRVVKPARHELLDVVVW